MNTAQYPRFKRNVELPLYNASRQTITRWWTEAVSTLSSNAIMLDHQSTFSSAVLCTERASSCGVGCGTRAGKERHPEVPTPLLRASPLPLSPS